MRRTHRLVAVAALVLAAGLGLSGCVAANEGAVSSGDAPMSGGSEAGAVARQDAAAGAPDTVAQGERQVVQTGYATITVSDPAEAADEATLIAVRSGGRVDDRTEQSADGSIQARATLTLRIPADELDAALDAVKGLGDPVSVSVSANDVTATVTDLDARISALQASVDRLLALLGQADTTADLIQIESSLSDRQAELDALSAQRAALGEQVAMSTLTVDLVAPGTVVGSGPQDFWQGIAAGWSALVAAVSGFLVGLGVFIPWLLPLGSSGWWCGSWCGGCGVGGRVGRVRVRAAVREPRRRRAWPRKAGPVRVRGRRPPHRRLLHDAVVNARVRRIFVLMLSPFRR